MKLLLIITCMILSFFCFPKTVNKESTSKPATIAQSPGIFKTSRPQPSGKTINVSAGGDFQAALNAANPGDQILLQAGVAFTGNFTLPAKNGSEFIYIQTSEVFSLPPTGRRINKSFRAAMPMIKSPNADGAIKTAAGAHHYWFIGIEFGISEGVSPNYGIIVLGNGSSEQSSLSQAPHDIIIDQCYIHGNDTGDVSRGVALNSAAASIIDSYISNIHSVGFDTQAICGWNGPGPFKIVNNYLEASGENVLFGGADPHIDGLVPSDIEFRLNHCFKPLTWKIDEPSYAGKHWTVKNLFELKNAQRVLIDGNIFENNWQDAQVGFAILFTPRNQDGKAPWSVVQDITFTNNIVRHAGAAINILGSDDIYTSRQTQRIKILNNLFDDIGGSKWGGNGRFLQILNGTAIITVDHNTILHTGAVIMAEGKPHINFVFSNNISSDNEYGVTGTNTGNGNNTLQTYFPDAVFTKNILIGEHAADYSTKPGNYFPLLLKDVGFKDPARSIFTLSPESRYKNAGSDGKDPGANINIIKTFDQVFSR